MKTIINKLVLLFAAAAAIAGCKESKVDFAPGNVTGVTQLVSPKADASATLFETGVLIFQWTGVPASYGAVSYEIVFFASETGQEIYRYRPESNNLAPKMEVPHNIINLVAQKAGVQFGQSGDIWWNVEAVQANARAASKAPNRKLTVKRYAKIDDQPVRLFITGEGSEGGADITAAQQFRDLGNGEFVIYTEIKAEEGFIFTNRNAEGNMRRFAISEEGRIIETDTEMTVETDGVYRIALNFANSTATMEAISDVQLFEVWNQTRKNLEYAGSSIWKSTMDIDFFVANDNRYNFRAKVDGTEKLWGSSNSDATGVPGDLEGDTYNIYERAMQSDRGAYSFRIMADLKGMESVTVIIDMTGTPTHRFDLGNLTVNPVTEFTSPAEGASIQLLNDSSASQTFSWVAPATEASIPPQFYVVFYVLNGSEYTEIGSILADNGGKDTSASIKHSELENLARTAGIAGEEQGDIYWSVNTKLFKNEAISPNTPRKLTVTRIQGIPETVFLTGSGTEYGTTIADAGRMSPKRTFPTGTDNGTETVETGVFEIYTQLSTGTYNFVNKRSAGYRTFGSNGGNISETTTPFTVTTPGLYRMTANFNTGAITLQAITSMQMRTAGGNKFYDIPYEGKGKWRHSTLVAAFAGNWDDDRFFFFATIGGVANTKIGSKFSNFNNGASYGYKMNGQGDGLGSGHERWYYAYLNGNTSDHDWGWKVWSSYRGNTTKKMDVTLDMSGEYNSQEWHYFVYINYLEN